MSLAFPAGVFPRAERWFRRGVTIGGGVSVAGGGLSAATDGGGLWVCEQEFLVRPESVGDIEMLDGAMDFGSVAVVVPAFAYQLDYDGPPLSVVPASLRATTIIAKMGAGGFPFEGGRHHFSIVHRTKGKRLYRVIAAKPMANGQQVLTIRPPLREAVTVELLNRTDLGCVMRLANPEDYLSPRDLTRTLTMTPTWVEALDAS